MSILPFVNPARITRDDLNKADYARLLAVWGNGDAIRGYSLFYAATMRVAHARAKHPKYARGASRALEVIKSEFDELTHAVNHESPWRQYDEALDVLVTALRFVANEHGESRPWQD